MNAVSSKAGWFFKHVAIFVKRLTWGEFYWMQSITSGMHKNREWMQGDMTSLSHGHQDVAVITLGSPLSLFIPETHLKIVKLKTLKLRRISRLTLIYFFVVDRQLLLSCFMICFVFWIFNIGSYNNGIRSNIVSLKTRLCSTVSESTNLYLTPIAC